MRYFSILFIVFFSNVFFAQTKLFETPITTNMLQSTERLTNDYAETFNQIFYYNQSNFDLNKDYNFVLPSGHQIKARYDKSYNYKNGSNSASYKILNEPYSELVFSKYNDLITGMYVSENLEKVIFTQTSNNVFAISYVDEIKMIAEEFSTPCFVIDDEQENRGIDHANICLESSTCSGNVTIDVMFVYTQSARLAWGGVNGVNSNLANIMTNLNNSMVLSGINNVNFNIVHTYEVDYVESGSQSTDLNNLRNTTDGFMDEIHDLRNTYGADLVAMIIGDTSGGCGIGNLNTNATNYNSSAAFSVTRFGCAVGNLTLAHEMGHNMGLRHDWFVDSGVTPCSHHHGYVNQTAITNGTSSTTAQRWRTIMAYNNNCSNAGFNCTRINRWSNPDFTHNGDVMGVEIGDFNPANEAYAFRRMACVVADFRTPLNTNDFDLADISIYPNPAQSFLFIETTLENLQIEVHNMMGQSIFQTNEKSINVESLLPGVYFLHLKSENSNGFKTLKFIKQ